MEPSSGPEPQPEASPARPPGLELGNGLAIFSLVFLIFLVAFNVIVAQRIIALTPELQDMGMSAATMETELFQQRAQELDDHGDVISYAYLLAGGLDVLVLLAFCWWWQKKRLTQFLALRPPAFKPLLAWAAFFLLAVVVLTLLESLFPDFNNPSAKVIASATNKPLLILGVAVVPALFEEFALRGLFFGTLRQALDKHLAVAITAALFTLIHLHYPWFVLLFSVLPLGVLLGYARANTGSIWTSVLLHLMNNLLAIALPEWA